jgi:hypothetical protein
MHPYIIEYNMTPRAGGSNLPIRLPFPLGDHEPWQIFGNMATGRFGCQHMAASLTAACTIVGKSTMGGIEAASGQP